MANSHSNANPSLLSIWARGSPADQVTPKASAQSSTSTECDPFDASLRFPNSNSTSIDPIPIHFQIPFSPATISKPSPKTTKPIPNLRLPSPSPLNLVPGHPIPMPLSPPGHDHLAQPPLTPKPGSSQQLSMATNALKALTPQHTNHSLSTSTSTSTTTSTTTSTSTSTSTSTNTNTNTSNQSTIPPRPPPRPQNSLALPPKGLLSVKILSARALKCSAAARPYVVAQFDHNEFVSREPIAEDGHEARGVVSELSGQSRRVGSTGSADVGTDGSLDGKGIVCLSGQNPCWKQTVDFDVAQHDPTDPCPTLHVSVYDRSIGDHPSPAIPANALSGASLGGVEGVEMFLGETEIRLDFERLGGRKGWVEEWYELTMKAPETTAESSSPSAGSIRVSLHYHDLTSRKSLSVSDFEFLKMIGKGTFGRVFQVRKKDTRRIYAMKVLSKREVIDKKEVAHTIGERDILKQSNLCPFLLGLKFSFQSPGELFLVMDYKSGGELFHHLQKEGRFTEERARFYTAEIVLALEHLHKYNIVYRDLKPENILLDATGHIVLCDFGLSKPNLRPDELTTTFCGTTEYLAPEVLLDDHGYSKLVDFWSLGVLLFEMCCGWSPFYAEDNQQMYKNICFGKIKFPRGVIGDDGKQFVKALLNRNPKHRLGAHLDTLDLKQHAFFKTIDWAQLSTRSIVPPFKPHIESDDSVANFDQEFTGLNVEEQLPMTVMIGMNGKEGWFDEEDRSADWVKQASYVKSTTFAVQGTNGGNKRTTTAAAAVAVKSEGPVGSGGQEEKGRKQKVEQQQQQQQQDQEQEGEVKGAVPVKGTTGWGRRNEEQDEFLGFSYHGESEIGGMMMGNHYGNQNCQQQQHDHDGGGGDHVGSSDD